MFGTGCFSLWILVIQNGGEKKDWQAADQYPSQACCHFQVAKISETRCQFSRVCSHSHRCWHGQMHCWGHTNKETLQKRVKYFCNIISPFASKRIIFFASTKCFWTLMFLKKFKHFLLPKGKKCFLKKCFQCAQTGKLSQHCFLVCRDLSATQFSFNLYRNKSLTSYMRKNGLV